MAQTKRKRQTKHRGTAAGVVTSRGRTSKPPDPDTVKKQKREDAKVARLMKRPTWTSAALRSLLAALFIMVFLLVTTHGNVLAAVGFAAIAAVIYIPTGYYIETYMWRRRMRKQGQPTS
jgi:magnesium-transporting ATPase (P-type)